MVELWLSLAVMGIGMGMAMLSLLLAGQSAVPREQLGIATSLGQFSRSIGGAVGVALMGTVMTASLAALQGMGVPLARAMEMSLHRAFVAGAIVSLLALVAAVKVPRGFPQRAAGNVSDRDSRLRIVHCLTRSSSHASLARAAHAAFPRPFPPGASYGCVGIRAGVGKKIRCSPPHARGSREPLGAACDRFPGPRR